jgi:DNA segregation ATPase FtsK/SpoIIIE-like protein
MISAAHPLELLRIDELARYTDHESPTVRKAVHARLRNLVSIGMGAGLIPVLATQKPESKVVPTAVRDLLSTRIAVRTTSPDMSNTILGDGAAKLGMDATILEAKGHALVRLGGPDAVRMRSHLVEVADLRRVREVALEMRRTAGTLPGQDEPPPSPVLVEMAKVIRMRGGEYEFSTELANLLADGDLKALKSAAGIDPRPVRAASNRMAYWLEDVESALSRTLSAGSPRRLQVVGRESVA